MRTSLVAYVAAACVLVVHKLLPSRYTSDFSYVSSPCLNAMYDAGLTFEAYDSSTWSADNAMLENLTVDVTFADSWSSSVYNALVITPDQEATNLASAEYVKVFGALFNLEALANSVFDEIEARWTCTEAAAASFGDATLNVLWASWSTDYTGAAGWSVGSCPNYYCEAIEAAGGDMITTSLTGSVILWCVRARHVFHVHDPHHCRFVAQGLLFLSQQQRIPLGRSER